MGTANRALDIAAIKPVLSSFSQAIATHTVYFFGHYLLKCNAPACGEDNMNPIFSENSSKSLILHFPQRLHSFRSFLTFCLHCEFCMQWGKRINKFLGVHFFFTKLHHKVIYRNNFFINKFHSTCLYINNKIYQHTNTLGRDVYTVLNHDINMSSNYFMPPCIFMASIARLPSGCNRVIQRKPSRVTTWIPQGAISTTVPGLRDVFVFDVS